MKTLHKILFLAVGVLSFAACQKDENTVAKAILASARTLNYAGQGAAPQTISVVADADWTVEFPDWIAVSPQTGSAGTTEVAVSASDNVRTGALDLPRKGEVVFKGANLRANFTIAINQDGDLYRDLEDGTVTDILALEEGRYLSLVGALAIAADADGYVLSDGTSMVYVSGTGAAVGDVVSVKGTRGSYNGVPAVVSPERLTVTGSSAVTYPDEAADVTAYSGTAIEYVAVMGEVAGSGGKYTVTVKGGDPVLSFYGEDTAYADLDGHNVNLTGYAVGKASTIAFIPVSDPEDLGPNVTIYFTEDFEWLSEWTGAADDSVGDNNPSGKAPSLASDANGKLARAALEDKGYTFLNSKGYTNKSTEPDPSGSWEEALTSIYLQKNYLKFGKTSYNAGIVLPPLSAIEDEAVDVELSFDWCWHVTAAFKPDLMTLVLLTTGGGTFTTGTSTSDLIDSTQSKVDGSSKIEWSHVTVRINGATAATRIAIRPSDPNPWSLNTARGQNRWYLDNIRIVSVKK